MSIWPSVKPVIVKPEESPPQNGTGPTTGKVEPAAKRSRRRVESGDATPAAPDVKGETDFEIAARQISASNAAEDARLAALGPRARAFEDISHEVGFTDPIVDAVRYLDALEIVTAVGVIRFKNIDDVLDPRRFEAAVNKAGVIVLPDKAWRGTRKEHLALGMKITRLARVDGAFNETATTWGWIRKYGELETDRLLPGNRRIDYYTPESRLPSETQSNHAYSARPTACWREGDKVLVHLETLLQRLTSNGVKEVSSERELATRLMQCGFRSERNQRGFRIDGRLYKVRVWANNLSAVPDLAGAKVDIVTADGTSEAG
jgi:hypothetical protein